MFEWGKLYSLLLFYHIPRTLSRCVSLDCENDENTFFSLLTNGGFYVKIILHADVAQWQSARFPSQTRGFDSRHLLQTKRPPLRWPFCLEKVPWSPSRVARAGSHPRRRASARLRCGGKPKDTRRRRDTCCGIRRSYFFLLLGFPSELFVAEFFFF